MRIRDARGVRRFVELMMYGWCLRAEPLTHTDRCVAMPRSRCIQKSRCGRRLWMLAARQTRRSIIASHSHSTALTLWTVDDAAALHCFADTITHQSTFRSLSVVRYERMFFILSLEKNYSETYNAATFGCVCGWRHKSWISENYQLWSTGPSCHTAMDKSMSLAEISVSFVDIKQ